MVVVVVMTWTASPAGKLNFVMCMGCVVLCYVGIFILEREGYLTL